MLLNRKLGFERSSKTTSEWSSRVHLEKDVEKSREESRFLVFLGSLGGWSLRNIEYTQPLIHRFLKTPPCSCRLPPVSRSWLERRSNAAGRLHRRRHAECLGERAGSACRSEVCRRTTEGATLADTVVWETRECARRRGRRLRKHADHHKSLSRFVHSFLGGTGMPADGIFE